ncbi:Peripheral Plasma Membrane Protein Cask, partial [Manis pentadactyla]
KPRSPHILPHLPSPEDTAAAGFQEAPQVLRASGGSAPVRVLPAWSSQQLSCNLLRPSLSLIAGYSRVSGASCLLASTKRGTLAMLGLGRTSVSSDTALG